MPSLGEVESVLRTVRDQASHATAALHTAADLATEAHALLATALSGTDSPDAAQAAASFTEAADVTHLVALLDAARASIESYLTAGGPTAGGPTATMGTRRRWHARNHGQSPAGAPPKEPGDAALPNGIPVYHRGHSTTIGYDLATLSNRSMIAPDPEHHDVIVHGTDKGFFDPGALNAAGANIDSGALHPNHVADAVIGNPHYTGGPIRLISCRSGSIAHNASDVPAAQALANALGVPVTAPTKKVGILRFRGPNQNPLHSDGGCWRIFLPLGEAR
ncbi:hypothetical protein [Actinosynnema sp. NPDC020468]|uniref:hypothetical protein n=1 Tax=Actinosynnema sp. NPDC020468 TaxID=3154488 RepID=UPI0033E37A8E